MVWTYYFQGHKVNLYLRMPWSFINIQMIKLSALDPRGIKSLANLDFSFLTVKQNSINVGIKGINALHLVGLILFQPLGLRIFAPFIQVWKVVFT